MDQGQGSDIYIFLYLSIITAATSSMAADGEGSDFLSTIAVASIITKEHSVGCFETQWPKENPSTPYLIQRNCLAS